MTIKTFTVLLCAFFSLSLWGQTNGPICNPTENWLGTGLEQSGYVRNMGEYNGRIYTLKSNPWIHETELWSYDGAWSNHGSVPLPPPERMAGLIEYQNQLIIGGYFDSLYTGISGTTGLVVWDSLTNSFSDLGGGINSAPFTKVNDLVVYQGKLIIAGEFTGAGSLTGLKGIAMWDGISWDSLPGQGMIGPGRGTRTVRLYDLNVWDGKLVIGGDFSYPNGNDVVAWDGTSWQSFSGDPDEFKNTDWIQEVASYQGDLVVFSTNIRNYGPDSINFFARWDGQKWNPMGMQSPGDRILYAHDMVEYEGYLYMVMQQTQSDQMDGQDVGEVVRWDGTGWRNITNSGGNAYDLLIHKDRLYMGGSLNQVCGVRLGNIIKFCTPDICQPVSGKVFQDNNLDCQYDNGDDGLNERWVKATPGDIYIPTREDGSYAFLLDSGSYTLEAILPNYYDSVCPPSYPVPIGGDSLIDFALKPSGSINDLRVSVSAPWARPGFATRYTINYYNEGTTTQSPVVKYVLDSLMTYTGLASVTPDAVVGDTLIWNLGTMPPSSNGRFWIEATLPPDPVILGHFLALNAYILPSGNDSTPFNNSYEGQLEIIGAYDPNDKQVWPSGVDSTGKIPLQTQTLTYKIRFQNTGTAAAINVVVRDVIDSSLNIGSIKNIGVSHDYRFELEEGRQVKWTFEDIFLPDSNSNEPGSHGYILYTIDVNPGLADSTEIRNTAGIYFDFNPPIITNTTLSTLVQEKDTTTATDLSPTANEWGVALYPQPADEYVVVETSKNLTDATFVLRDLQGKLVLKIDHLNGNSFKISTGNLPTGLYLFELKGQRIKGRSGKLVVHK